jgi:hypothetical protein
MHLTEFSRAFDHKHGNTSTNANHQVDRIMCRLALALPVIAPKRSKEIYTFHLVFLIRTIILALYRRPILALARMILDPNAYIPEGERKKREVRLPKWDMLLREEYFELEEARKVMLAVLEFVKVGAEQLQSEVEGTGARWFERGPIIALPWTQAT